MTRRDLTFEELLTRELSPPLARIAARLIDHLQQAMRRWPGSAHQPPSWAQPVALPHRLVLFLKEYITTQLNELQELRRHYSEYSRRYRRAATDEERRRLILDFAQSLGAGRRQLLGDRRALRRWLGHDTMADRYRRRHTDSERRLAFCLDRLGILSALVLQAAGPQQGYEKIWRHLALEPLIRPLLAHDGDSRVRIAAFRCLTQALGVLPSGEHESYVSENTLHYIYRAAQDSRQEVWIQCEALSLLQRFSPRSLQTVLQQRLTRPREGDDLFVRRRAAQLLGRNLHTLPALAEWLPAVLQDPSAYVRQGLAEILAELPLDSVATLLPRLILQDVSPQVRAAALLQIPALLSQPALWPLPLNPLRQSLEQEQDAFVLRVALRIGATGQRALIVRNREEQARYWSSTLTPSLDRLHRQSEHLAVRRWAVQTLERLWVQSSLARRELFTQFETLLAAIEPGKGKRIRRRLANIDETTLGRILAVLSQNDYGIELHRGLLGARLNRGHRFRFRGWRLLHEFRHPGTDKRQAFRHTVGRIFHGALHAPSSILAELAQTKVPGEPLYLGAEDGWRPYLPLVDELISCVDQGRRPLRLYTSEGVTEIMPPRFFPGRLWARLVLTWRFAHYAHLRNWQEDDQTGADSYLGAIRKLGFRTRLRPHDYRELDITETVDPQVQRFFPAFFPLADLELWESLRDYFFSVYKNSLYELSLFLAACGSLFFGRHIYINRMIRRSRRRIPLVIGGWGTRGKSGTERLKAALFNGLGYSVFSKTTGCEAMFLHAYPYNTLREMFVFRPYDKATIWEQTHLLRLADRLQSEVFLWECMGLTPSYVYTLQRQWMQDDLATITNTYPDHEDLQGPAGYDIPQVMTNFIPRRSLLLTSEEQMLPILRSAARSLETRIKTVDWLEAGLLTPDVLNRFPYEEHPYNIALVLALAEELGIGKDFALKEMADRVVLDLGVLKTYPKARVHGRELQFVNGMSANERYGCLGNWKRMHFDDQDPYQEPGVWITTVVNNRADRVPRSRVFAGILVADISADRHFLIGTNLNGLQGYLRESWESYAGELSLWPRQEDTDPEKAREVLQRFARRMRIPWREEHLQARLNALLQGLNLEPADGPENLWQDPDALQNYLSVREAGEQGPALLAHLDREKQAYEAYRKFADRLSRSNGQDRNKLDTDFRDLLWRWFETKLVVIDDPYASGEQIIRRICRETPPGMFNRIMGLQNIKGPGLDFVYRWQAWETCYLACEQLLGRDTAAVRQGLQTLAGFQEYGQLSELKVQETVAAVKPREIAQSEVFQAELALILSNLQQTLAGVQASLEHSSGGTGLLTKLAGAVEAFLDTGDAVRRRKTADRIYRDLASERISHQRAAVELKALNRRQKGGWLAQSLYTLAARLRGPGV